MDDTFRLQSSDGVVFTVVDAVAQFSKTISDLRKEADTENEPVFLKDIDSKTLELVVQYLMYMKDLPPVVEVPEDPELHVDDVNHVLDKPLQLTTFETEMVSELEYKQLEKLMCAGNYLDIPKLTAVAMRAIAYYKILGIKEEDLYALFEVVDPVTPEDEAAVLAENPWLADK